MDMEIIKEDNNLLEIKVVGLDLSVLKHVVERLNENKDVAFAAHKIEHPNLEGQYLIVQTKKVKPASVLSDVLEEIKADVTTFKGNFSKK